jgi:hypothetical protein
LLGVALGVCVCNTPLSCLTPATILHITPQTIQITPKTQTAHLRHDADLRPEPARVERPEVGAVEQDAAFGGVVQPQQERDERRLAAAAEADERGEAAGRERERHAAQRGRVGAVGVAMVVEGGG